MEGFEAAFARQKAELRERTAAARASMRAMVMREIRAVHAALDALERDFDAPREDEAALTEIETSAILAATRAIILARAVSGVSGAEARNIGDRRLWEQLDALRAEFSQRPSPAQGAAPTD